MFIDRFAPLGAPARAPSGAPARAPSGAPARAPSGAPARAVSGGPLTGTPTGLLVSALVGALCLTGAGRPALAKPSAPTAYLPVGALAIATIPDPRGTLSRLEAFARDAGIAPAPAEAGWMTELLLERQPGLADVDLSQPVWVAVTGDPVQKATDDEAVPDLIVIAKSKSSRRAKRPKPWPGLKVTRKGGWLIARTEGTPAPRKSRRKFAFARSTRTLQDRSDLVLSVDLSALGALVETTEPDRLAELASAGIDRMTVGVGVRPEGVRLLAQQHVKSRSKDTKLNPKLNTAAPLISGLPAGSYMLLYASRHDSSAQVGLQQALRAGLTSLEQTNPGLASLFRALTEIDFADSGGCEHFSLGANVPGRLESAYVLSSSRCKDAEAASAAFLKAAEAFGQAAAQTARETARETAGEAPFAIDVLAKPRKVKTFSMVGARLVLNDDGKRPGAESPLWTNDLPASLESPIWVGAVDRKHHILTWNAPIEWITALAEASVERKPLALPPMPAAEQALLTPRMTEGYLQLGEAVGPMLPEILAPLRLLLRTVPPIAYSGQVQGDGSLLSQIWLPRQLAQMAVVAFQLAQVSAIPAPAPPKAPPAPKAPKAPKAPSTPRPPAPAR